MPCFTSIRWCLHGSKPTRPWKRRIDYAQKLIVELREAQDCEPEPLPDRKGTIRCIRCQYPVETKNARGDCPADSVTCPLHRRPMVVHRLPAAQWLAALAVARCVRVLLGML